MSIAARVFWSLLVIASTCTAVGGAQPLPSAGAAACAGDAVVGDPSFASRAVAFATRLADFGARPAASEGEALARGAVVAELEAIGLQVATEPFEYQSFAVEEVSLDLGGMSTTPVIVGLNPFDERLTFAGEATVVTDPAQASDALNGRIVVTNHPLMQLMIAEFAPSVVICVEPDELDAFVTRGNREVVLDVVGKRIVLRSANVVARSGPRRQTGSEILVTSHLDAYQDSPGANDNGTGLGLMIELARAFSKNAEELDIAIAFVAFGAEENGAIGSRAYLQDHLAELAGVVAVVNLDTLGGQLGPVIATTPSELPESSQRPLNRIPEALRGRAWEGPEGRWRIIHPEIIPTAFTSCYPEWLQEVVADSATDLGIEVTHVDLISDHRTFALAGVPAISIQSREHQIHSEDDTADALVPKTVAASATLAARILCRLQDLPMQSTGSPNGAAD